MRVLHRPLLLAPLLAVGIANVIVWRGLQVGQASGGGFLAVLGMLALSAGALAPDRPGGALAMLLAPVLFVAGSSHGRPIDWILGIPYYPPILFYLVQQTAPLVIVTAALVWAGGMLGRREWRTRPGHTGHHGGEPRSSGTRDGR